MINLISLNCKQFKLHLAKVTVKPSYILTHVFNNPLTWIKFTIVESQDRLMDNCWDHSR